MVNDNYHPGGPRVPFDPDDPNLLHRPRPGDLQVGDAVRGSGGQGKILDIQGDVARVRWQARSETRVELHHLAKA